MNTLLRSLVLALLLFTRDQAPLQVVAHAEATGQIGIGQNWGYFADFLEARGEKRRYPTIEEALLFASGAEGVHNFYPGDEALDIALGPRRALYMFDYSLAAYGSDVPTIAQVVARYPNRTIMLISEVNNPQFANYALPEVTARRIIDYVDWITPLCPTCQLYGPTLTQPAPGLDNPFDYERRFLQALKDMGRQDIIKRLSPAMNHYARGMEGSLWAWQIIQDTRALRAVSVAYGGMDRIIIPELGAPRGTTSEQAALALSLTAILPTVRAEAQVAYWFSSPWAFEPGRVFLGRGDTHNADYSLTAIGKALGLSGCLNMAAQAARWPAASVAAIMAAEKCR